MPPPSCNWRSWQPGVGHIGVVLLLVPAGLVRGRRADERFAAETAAARGADYGLALADHDALAEPDGPGGRSCAAKGLRAGWCCAGSGGHFSPKRVLGGWTVPAAWSRHTSGMPGEIPPGTGPASFTGAVLVPWPSEGRPGSALMRPRPCPW